MARTRTPDESTRDDDSAESAPAIAGGTPSQRRYPAVPAGSVLAKAAERAPAGKPATVDDVATAAVESKGSGSPVASEVRGPVEAQLGVDLSGARVHGDDGARQASAAMGARAFAHGPDVFLGPGESAGDLGLMAHELTHVAQQGAAGDKAAQRQVTVGAADTPAERQADAVAGAVTSGAAPTELIIDSGEPQTGQMLKTTFMTQLRERVTAAAGEELGPVWSVAGCPYIDSFFARHQNSDARTIETMARRYSGLSAARAAADYIPPICTRVRAAVGRWKAGEDVSADLAQVGVTGAIPPAPRGMLGAAVDGVGSLVSSALGGLSALLKPVEPAAAPTPESLVTQLGPGEPLPAHTASRMGGAFGGEDFSQVRVHTGPEAAQRASAEGAAAFAVGQNVVFNDGQYRPGTPVGDAMLAHELAHTVQQRGAGADAVAQRQPIGSESAAAEQDADQATVGVMSRLYGRGADTVRDMGDRVGPVLSTGYRLQRCDTTHMRESSRDLPAASEDGTFEGHEVGSYEYDETRCAPNPSAGPVTSHHTEHFTAQETLGFFDTESAAIACARAGGVSSGASGAVALEAGRYVAYRVRGGTPRGDVPTDRSGFHFTRTQTTPTLCTPGVVALISYEGQVLRPGAYDPARSASAPVTGEDVGPGDPFAGYREAFGGEGGDMNAVDRDRMMLAFEAAMRDNAMMVLAQSEAEVRRKQEQFGGGVDRVGPTEITLIKDTARELARLDRAIGEAETQAMPLRTPAFPGGPPTILPRFLAPESGVGTVDHALEGARRAEELKVERRYAVARYPLLARIEGAEALDRMAGLPDADLLSELGGQLPGILTSITETRNNIYNRSLNLWKIDPLIESTMAGLGISDTTRRGWVTAEKESRATAGNVNTAILTVFQIGFGVAAAFISGPVGVAFAAGAFGLGVADALQQTSDYFIERDASNTHMNPADSILPPELARGWGWLVVAWAGVLLDAFDMASAVNRAALAAAVQRVASGGNLDAVVLELGQATGRRGTELEALVARLRRAVGNFNPEDVVTEANRLELASRLGTSLTIDSGLPEAEVRVFYRFNRETGEITVDGVRCGSRANVVTTLAHIDVVQLLRRYQGVAGRLRGLWDRMLSLVGAESEEAALLHFERGSRGFESFVELRKYRTLMAERITRVGEASELGTFANAADTPLVRADLEMFDTEARLHAEVIEQAAEEAGSGFIRAVGDATKNAFDHGYRLPGYETLARADLTDAILQASDYYFRHEGGSTYLLIRKAGRNAPPRRALADGTSEIVEREMTRTEAAAALVASWGDEAAEAYTKFLDEQAALGNRVVPIAGMSATEVSMRHVIGEFGPDNFRSQFLDILITAQTRRGMAEAEARVLAEAALERMLSHDITVIRGTSQLRAFNYRGHFRGAGNAIEDGEDLHHLIPLYLGGDHTLENLVRLQEDLHTRMHGLLDEVRFDADTALAAGELQRAALTFERAVAVLRPGGRIEFVPLSEVVRRMAQGGTPP